MSSGKKISCPQNSFERWFHWNNAWKQELQLNRFTFIILTRYNIILSFILVLLKMSLKFLFGDHFEIFHGSRTPEYFAKQTFANLTKNPWNPRKKLKFLSAKVCAFKVMKSKSFKQHKRKIHDMELCDHRFPNFVSTIIVVDSIY